MTHLESYPPCVLSWRSSKSEIFVPNQDVFILLMIHGICSAADKISPSARHTAQWLNPVQLRSRMILLYNIIAAMTTCRKCFCSSRCQCQYNIQCQTSWNMNCQIHKARQQCTGNDKACLCCFSMEATAEFSDSHKGKNEKQSFRQPSDTCTNDK